MANDFDRERKIARLLAIASTTPEKRIYCQHPECRKTIYAKIHIVRVNGEVYPVGQRCFEKYYCPEENSKVFNTAPAVFQTLTEEQRRLLKENTEKFIEEYCAIANEENASPPKENVLKVRPQEDDVVKQIHTPWLSGFL